MNVSFECCVVCVQQFAMCYFRFLRNMTSNMKKIIAGTETMANRPKRVSEDMEKLMTDEVT